jgi:hypothetical protein
MCIARHKLAASWPGQVAVLLLCFSLTGKTAYGDFITPLSSSFALTANAQAGYSPNVSDTDAQSQGPTIDPLSVSVSANSIYSPINENLLATANGSATWTAPSSGLVTYTDVGWSNTIGGGNANLNSNSGWTYIFRSNVTGWFDIEFSVTADGSSSTTTEPLFGLNGFYLYEGAGPAPPSNATFETKLNTSGTVSLAISAGQTYSVQIQDFANISGGIGSTDAFMNGDFSFDVRSQSVPEPSSWIMAVCAALWGAISRIIGLSSCNRKRETAPTVRKGRSRFVLCV